MGSAETLQVGLNHTQDFACIGAFSAGGIGSNNFPKLFPANTPQTGPAINDSLRLPWVSVGTEDGLPEQIVGGSGSGLCLRMCDDH